MWWEKCKEWSNETSKQVREQLNNLKYFITRESFWKYQFSKSSDKIELLLENPYCNDFPKLALLLKYAPDFVGNNSGE